MYSTPPPDYGKFDLAKIRAASRGLMLLAVVLGILLAWHSQSQAQSSSDTVTTIRVGQTVSGSVSRSGETDFYSVPLLPGRTYRIEVALDTLGDSVLELWSPTGVKVEENDDISDSNRGSRLYYTAAHRGLYTIRVKGYSSSDTGSYRLSVRESQVPVNAEISVGDNVSGQLNSGEEYDGFAVTLQAGTSYRIETTLGTLGDSILTLYGPAGDQVANNDDINVDTNLASRIDYTPTHTGTHEIHVSGYGDATGSYRLSVQRHSPSVTTIRVGQTVSGSVSGSGETDFYSVPLLPGRTYRIEVTLGTLGDSVLELWSPTGVKVEENDDISDSNRGSRLHYTAAHRGLYTIRVKGYSSNDRGSYRLSVHESQVRVDSEISVGDNVSGQLNSGEEYDGFAVTLQADTAYRIEVSLGTLNDSVLKLYDPSGNKVREDDDSGPGRGSRIDYTPTRSGTYEIRVEGYSSNDTGSYRLSVQTRSQSGDGRGSDRGDDSSSGSVTTIRVGRTVSGNVASANETDRYAVRLQAGTAYRIEVTLNSLDDSVLKLYSPSGSKVDEDDDSGPGRGSRIDYTPTRTGTHEIHVEGYSSSDTGTYRLSVQTQGTADPPTPVPNPSRTIRVGQTLSGSLDSRGEQDRFTVSLQNRKAYRIEVSLGSLDDSVLKLYSPSGSKIAENDDGGTGRGSLINYTATSSGTYTIVVEGHSRSDEGSYQLSVQLPSQAFGCQGPTSGNAKDCGDLRVGRNRLGELIGSSNYHIYHMTLQAGTRYRIEVELNSLNRADLDLVYDVDSKTKESATDDGDTAILDYTPTQSGDYTLYLQGYRSSGTYTISLETRGTAAPPTPRPTRTPSPTPTPRPNPSRTIQVGQTLSGSLDSYNEQDRFTVSLQNRKAYRIEVSLGSLDDSVLKLYSPSGSKIAENDDGGTGRGSRIDYTATSSGTYTIIVEGHSGSDEGSYQLSVQLPSQYALCQGPTGGGNTKTCNIQVGQTMSGDLIGSGNHHLYLMTLQAGTAYRIEVSLNSLSGAGLELIHGTQTVAEDWGSSTVTLDYTPTSSGAYDLLLEGYGSNDTGTYTISLETR